MITLFSVHLLGGGKSAAPISCLSEKDESALDTYLSAHLSCGTFYIGSFSFHLTALFSELPHKIVLHLRYYVVYCNTPDIL